MRWSSFLLILSVAVFMFACGGDEYGDASGDGDNAAAPEGGDGTAKKDDAKTPPKKAAPRPSAMAETVGREWKMVDAVRDYDAKKKKALERAEYYATQSVSGDANFYLGLLWRIAEEHGKAGDTFVKFVKACPTDRNFLTGLVYAGTELAKDGRTAEAATYVTMFGQKFPDNKKYWKSMASKVGYAMLADGDFDDAIGMLGKAADLGDAYAGEEMVRCLWAKGEYDQARTKAEALLPQFDGHTEQPRYESLADLAGRMGKPAAALDVEGWSRDNIDTDTLKGKVFIVYFWNVRNRGTANKNERLLGKVYDRYNGEGLEIIGISKHSSYNLETGVTDGAMGVEEEVHNLKVWVFNFKTPWTLALVGNDKLHDFFGFRGKVPTIAVVGKKGNLRYFRDSSDEQGYAIVAKVVEKLLDE